MRATLREDVTLYGDGTGETLWRDRIGQWSDVARLGETFIANSCVTATRSSTRALVAPDTRASIAEWLRSTLHAPMSDESDEDLAALSHAKCQSIFGLSPLDFPAAYEDWRFTTDIYAVVDGVMYQLTNETFLRHRVLSFDERNTLRSPQSMPFLGGITTENFAALLVAAVPNRSAALGGLRGYRTALLDAGRAVEWLQARGRSGWPTQWCTEFYDDVVARVCGLDGIERIPMAVAVATPQLEEA